MSLAEETRPVLPPVAIDSPKNSIPPENLVISDYPATTTLDVLEITVGDVLRSAAIDSPDSIALTDGDGSESPRQWTYAQLYDEARDVARGLLTTFSPGERVVVWSANCPEWVILEFGMAIAGVVLVTANTAFTESELRYTASQSDAVGVIVGEGNRGKDLRPAAQAVVSTEVRLRHLIGIEDLVRVHADDPAAIAFPVVSPDDIAQVQFTSGTTGKPKGAMLRHRGVANNPRFYASGTGLTSRGGWINPFPLFHTGGCVTGVIGPVWMRMNHVLLRRWDPLLMLSSIDRQKANAALMIPTMATAVLNHPDRKKFDLSRLEYIGAGSAAVPPSLIRNFEAEFDCRFSNTFGQTEASPVVTQSGPDDSVEMKALSIGRPLVQTHLRIVDPDSVPVPIGEIGEICIKGYQVMAGYQNMPEATAKAIDSDGFLHTGDLGHMDEQGYIFIDGRLKDMIVRGGENVYPQEIEYRLVEHPLVAMAVVVGVPDPYWGEAVNAVIVPTDTARVPSVAELAIFSREVLHPFKVPTGWYFAESIPVLPSGKVPKFQVMEALLGGEYAALPAAEDDEVTS